MWITEDRRRLLSALPQASGYPGRMDELTRSFEFERRWFERLSTRLEQFEFGVAYLDEEYRQRYFSNFLLADKGWMTRRLRR